MKNKVIYFIAVLFAAFACFSCSNDSDSDKYNPEELIGEWEYKVCHFVFDYSEAKFELPDGITLGKLIPELQNGPLAYVGQWSSVPVDQLVKIIPGQIHSLFVQYLRGINFESETKLTLLINIDGQELDVPANYTVHKNIINITIDKASAGGNIPEEISLLYTIENDKLIIYFTKESIQTILTPDMLKSALPHLSTEEINTYIKDVLSKTKKLEIGAKLMK